MRGGRGGCEAGRYGRAAFGGSSCPLSTLMFSLLPVASKFRLRAVQSVSKLSDGVAECW